MAKILKTKYGQLIFPLFIYYRYLYYNKFIPNRRITNAKTPKHAMVITTQDTSVSQKPKRGNKSGKAKNIGSVGTTYQNVYQA